MPLSLPWWPFPHTQFSRWCLLRLSGFLWCFSLLLCCDSLGTEIYIFNETTCTLHLKTSPDLIGMVQKYFMWKTFFFPIQFSSVIQSCLTVCDPTDCSTPGFPVHHQLPELAQTHVHRVGDVIQQSHPLSSPSPPAFNLSQHQGLFQSVRSSHQVDKVLELQFQC